MMKAVQAFTLCVLVLALCASRSGAFQTPVTTPPTAAKNSVTLPIDGRLQWPDRDGYCGSNSIQMNALNFGSWISQKVVRASLTVGGCTAGGVGNEILHNNIGCALKTLKFDFNEWDYRGEPVPQSQNYSIWMKKHLAAGHPVVWFIYCKGDGPPHGPHGGEKGYGYYDHIEPVVGIFSNHSLESDSEDINTFYADDVLAHHSDWNQKTFYRTFESLPDGPSMDTNCRNVFPMGGGPNEAYPCIPQKVNYGVSMLGRLDPKKITVPVHLSVDNYKEPDTVEGKKPDLMTGTVTVKNLQNGRDYVLLRYNSYTAAPVDSVFSNASSTHTFTANSDTYSYVDPVKLVSDTSVYYYALPKSAFDRMSRD